MVFFVCEGCNETLKKNQVDKHISKCRKCQGVTCVDCSKTFRVDEYQAHTSCVSEAEKYEKALYKPKSQTKANPQEVWMALIGHAASRSQEASSSVAPVIQKISQLENVPRNKNKFLNFAKNSLRLNNVKLLEEVWKFIEKIKGEQAKSTAATTAKTTTGGAAGGKTAAGPPAAGGGAGETVDKGKPSVSVRGKRKSDDGESGAEQNAKKKSKKEVISVMPVVEVPSVPVSVPKKEASGKKDNQQVVANTGKSEKKGKESQKSKEEEYVEVNEKEETHDAGQKKEKNKKNKKAKKGMDAEPVEDAVQPGTSEAAVATSTTTAVDSNYNEGGADVHAETEKSTKKKKKDQKKKMKGGDNGAEEEAGTNGAVAAEGSREEENVAMEVEEEETKKKKDKKKKKKKKNKIKKTGDQASDGAS